MLPACARPSRHPIPPKSLQTSFFFFLVCVARLLQFVAFLCCINKASLYLPTQQSPACGIISDFWQKLTFMQSFYYNRVSNLCGQNVFKTNYQTTLSALLKRFYDSFVLNSRNVDCLIGQTASSLHGLDSKL